LPRLWIVLLAPLVPYAAFVTWFNKRLDKAWDATDEVDLDVDETFDVVSNARDIKLFGAEKSQILRRSLLSQYRTKLTQSADWLSSFNRAGQALIKGGSCIALMLVCFDALSEGAITVGQLGLLISLQETLFAPLNQIYYIFESTQTALRKVKPFFGLLREIDPLSDRPEALDLPVLADKLSFKNVSYSYLTSQPTPTLNNLSFDVPRGSTLAVVGPSGAGKSTLSSLVLRFADPTSGSILWDGIDLRDSTRNSLRKLALLVPQGSLPQPVPLEFAISLIFCSCRY
jgi:ABC-type multidrug transport system fused ATPase/permease subunit